MQLVFYNTIGQQAGVMYVTPGQGYEGCIDFGGTVVASYEAVQMLVPITSDVENLK